MTALSCVSSHGRMRRRSSNILGEVGLGRIHAPLASPMNSIYFVLKYIGHEHLCHTGMPVRNGNLGTDRTTTTKAASVRKQLGTKNSTSLRGQTGEE